MFVRQRMSKNPITVKPETPVAEAQVLMRRNKIHRLPVLGHDHKLQGIVTEKDLMYASPSPASTLDVYEMNYLLSKLQVHEVMSSSVVTVTEDTPVEEAARIMADNNIGGLPVMRGDSLVGIITESDLFKIFLEMFGSRTSAVRGTFVIPEKKGELAQLAGAIAQKGGNIIAFGTFLGEDDTEMLTMVKVDEISEDDLAACVQPYVRRIVDIRRT